MVGIDSNLIGIDYKWLKEHSDKVSGPKTDKWRSYGLVPIYQAWKKRSWNRNGPQLLRAYIASESKDFAHIC